MWGHKSILVQCGGKINFSACHNAHKLCVNRLMLLLSGGNSVSIPHGLKSFKMLDIILQRGHISLSSMYSVPVLLMVRCCNVFSLLAYSPTSRIKGVCGL